MAKVHFNVDAYTARLIGRENVAKLNSAVLELVKNTYDADASVCFLYYDEKNDVLYLGDNGDGMTEDVIKTHWMTIGQSSKKKAYRTTKERIQTGAKGIGRFALDRIADRCSMLTKSEKEGGYLWEVDWRDFDKEAMITEVSAELSETELHFLDFMDDAVNQHVQDLVSDKFTNHGTIFKMNILRDEWGTERLEDIKSELASLVPHELKKTFNIFLFDNRFNQEEATVLKDESEFSFDYKIEFSVSESGSVEIKMWRSEFDFRSRFEEIMNRGGFTADDQRYFSGEPIVLNSTFSEIMLKQKNAMKNSIGSFNGTLYFAKQSVSELDTKRLFYKDISARGNFGAFGGIKIYRDNFRVRPYGESHSSNFDWLMLDKRKTSSPAGVGNPNGAWRVSAHQMLGSVFISRENPNLVDQANREGMVETEEFLTFKNFLIEIIKIFEKERQFVGRKLSKIYEEDAAEEKLRAEIRKKAEKQWASEREQENRDTWQTKDSKSEKDTNNNRFQIGAAEAERVIEAKEEVIRSLEDENRLLRVLASTGITTNTYIHEFREQTHNLSMKIVMAKEALQYDKDIAEAISQLEEANIIRKSFSSWFKVTIDSVRRDKRELKKTDLKILISSFLNAWKQVNIGHDINIKFTCKEEAIYLSCFPYEVEILVSNLISNSVYALKTIPFGEFKLIEIELVEKDDHIIINYSDNGPGLISEYKNNPDLILDSFETGKISNTGEKIGTGMGMWIINRTIQEYNGRIDLSRNRTIEKGFHCKFTLPKNI